LILIDANLLIYASVDDFQQHEQSREWLDTCLSGTARVGLPWATLTSYLRLITSGRVFRRPRSSADALGQVRDWLKQPVTWTPEPTSRHAEVLGKLLAIEGVRGDLVPDAHLAAIAIEHGLTLMSNDSDFARFSGLRWENPLSS